MRVSLLPKSLFDCGDTAVTVFTDLVIVQPLFNADEARSVGLPLAAGEIAVIFDATEHARAFLLRWRILRLLPEIAFTAAQIDRELIEEGRRLGENDNWIAGF